MARISNSTKEKANSGEYPSRLCAYRFHKNGGEN